MTSYFYVYALLFHTSISKYNQFFLIFSSYMQSMVCWSEMQSVPEDYPITGVCIVSDPTKVPPGYHVVILDTLHLASAFPYQHDQIAKLLL